MESAPIQSDSYRVFCFPSAGGGVAHYYRWRRHARAGMRVEPVCPAGRESRHREPLIRSFPELIDDLMMRIEPLLDRPYALFGHSMGALVGYEIASRLTRMGKPPLALFAAACKAPHRRPTNPMLHHLSESELVRELQRRYGDHGSVFERPEARRLFLPIVQADLQAIETHQARELNTLPCPVQAIGGQDDRTIRKEHLDEWSQYSQQELPPQQRPGGHFFVQTDRDWLLRRIDDVARNSLTSNLSVESSRD